MLSSVMSRSCLLFDPETIDPASNCGIFLYVTFYFHLSCTQRWIFCLNSLSQASSLKYSSQPSSFDFLLPLLASYESCILLSILWMFILNLNVSILSVLKMLMTYYLFTHCLVLTEIEACASDIRYCSTYWATLLGFFLLCSLRQSYSVALD